MHPDADAPLYAYSDTSVKDLHNAQHRSRIDHKNHILTLIFAMSDVKNLRPDLDKLDHQIDSLEDALEPLIENLDGLSSKLPLLDKAKLFSLSAYAIESLIFCAY